MRKKGARTRETSRINHHLHFPIVISCYTSFFLSFCVESTRKKKTLRQPVRPPWIQKRVFSAKPGWPGYASASAGRGVPKWISTRASLSLSTDISCDERWKPDLLNRQWYKHSFRPVGDWRPTGDDPFRRLWVAVCVPRFVIHFWKDNKGRRSADCFEVVAVVEGDETISCWWATLEEEEEASWNL